MRSCILGRNVSGLISTMIVVLVVAGPTIPDAPAAGEIERHYELKAQLFAFEPGLGVDSFNFHGSGSIGGTGGSLGFSCSYAQRRFSVKILPSLKEHRYGVKVEVTPYGSDTVTEATSYQVDLSDLRATGLELARDDDGRVYVLNLTPGIKITDNTVRKFDPDRLGFETWIFTNSTIILNDHQYLGKMGASGGPKAWFDAPGVAKIEFSLLEFNDARPLGELKNGRIRITAEDGTTIDIYSVSSGPFSSSHTVLKGGPYRVWVRWSPPTMTLEEHQVAISRRLLELEAMFEAGETDLSRSQIDAIRRQVESGAERAGSIHSGVGGFGDN